MVAVSSGAVLGAASALLPEGVISTAVGAGVSTTAGVASSPSGATIASTTAGASGGGVVTAQAVAGATVASATASGAGPVTASATAVIGASDKVIGAVKTGSSLMGAATLPFAIFGPLGWMAVGSGLHADDRVSWDCWRQILHEEDTTTGREEGRLLRDIAMDVRVRKVIPENNSDFVVENIWDEKFNLCLVNLPASVGGGLAFHAVQF